MFGLALLMAGAIAATPVPADWRLVEVAGDGQSVAAIDASSLRRTPGGKQARVAIVYREAEIAAVGMTLTVDCARGRERAASVKLHDGTGRSFPQAASKGFQPSDPAGPWRKAFCAPAGASLTPLGTEFPIAAARKLFVAQAPAAP